MRIISLWVRDEYSNLFVRGEESQCVVACMPTPAESKLKRHAYRGIFELTISA